MTLRPPARRRVAAVTALSLLLGTAGAIAVAAPAQAATFIVTNTNNAGAGSLRDAIASANANAGADTISFDGALNGQTIQISTVLLITESLTISGLGSGSLTISRTANSDVFAFQPTAADQDFTLSGFNVQGNNVVTGSGVVANDNVATPRNVTIVDVTFRFMRTSVTGGAAMIIDGIAGTLRVEDSFFSANSAAASGGAISATGVGTQITISDSEFTINEAVAGDGGAIAIDSPLAGVTITGSEFTSNFAGGTGAGGGVYINNAAAVSVSDTTFLDNGSTNAGGGLAVFDATSLVVTDSLFTSNAVSGNRGGGLYIGDLTGGATITGTTFSENEAAIAGGAVATLDNTDIIIQNSTFVDNFTDGDGGAFFTDDTTGTISIERSTFQGNESNGDGGALFFTVLSGTVTIHSSTFFDNVTDGIGDSLAAPSIEGELTIINSTLDEQFASALTVAVVVETGGEFRLRYSTVAGQVFFDSNEGLAEILSTIIDGLGQPAVDVAFNDPATVSYSIHSSALTSSITDGGGNRFSVLDAKLGTLADNGGPTLTRLPLAGSPAIDAGFPGGMPPTFDQRFTGFLRVSGGRVDVGAVEVQQALPATGAPFPGALVSAGGLLLLVGAGIVLVARRRPRHP